MNFNQSFRYLLRTCLVMLVILTAACATIRKVTYPPDFIYLDSSQVQTSMLRMSLAMRRIDEILASQVLPAYADQQRILESLNTIDEMADSLDTGGHPTNHLLLDENLTQFKIEVRNALRTASADPPQFYAAGRLSAHCTGCHRFRN